MPCISSPLADTCLSPLCATLCPIRHNRVVLVSISPSLLVTGQKASRLVSLGSRESKLPFHRQRNNSMCCFQAVLSLFLSLFWALLSSPLASCLAGCVSLCTTGKKIGLAVPIGESHLSHGMSGSEFSPLFLQGWEMHMPTEISLYSS